METVSSAISHTSARSPPSVTPANVFAFLFELMVLVLIVLSIVVLVRRYLGARDSPTPQTYPRRVFTADLEAQDDHTGASIRNEPRFWTYILQHLGLGSGDDSPGDNASLLDKDRSMSLSLPVTTTDLPPTPRIHLLFNGFGGTCTLPGSGVEALHSRSLHSHIQSPCGVLTYSSCEVSQFVRADIYNSRRPSDPRTKHSSSTDYVNMDPSSPESTYSEPDSPTVTTPPLDSYLDFDMRAASDEVDQLQTPTVLWGAVDDEQPSNLPQLSGCAFSSGVSPRSKNTYLSGVDSDILSNLTAVSIPSEADLHLLPAAVIVEDKGSDDDCKSLRTTATVPLLDACHIPESVEEGPAHLIFDGDVTHGKAFYDDYEGWQTVLRLGGSLTAAFASPFSSESLREDDKCDGDNDQPTEEAYVLHHTQGLCQGHVESAALSSTAVIEYCDPTSSSSSWSIALSESDARSDYHDVRSDIGSDSSFYSCSAFSYSEDIELDGSYSIHKQAIGDSLPTTSAGVGQRGYHVKYGYAF
ncbi:hypothetical protein BC628DRAFT_1082422 [Trametes gibbosa]|nr:hypothetical protein BC628DRAFT_1082422 [Trametes gibbosa]